DRHDDRVAGRLRELEQRLLERRHLVRGSIPRDGIEFLELVDDEDEMFRGVGEEVVERRPRLPRLVLADDRRPRVHRMCAWPHLQHDPGVSEESFGSVQRRDESGEYERALPGAGWPDHREEGRCLQEGGQVLDLMLTPEERLRLVLFVCAPAVVAAGELFWTG